MAMRGLIAIAGSGVGRTIAGSLATLALAFAVAASVKRSPPEFAALPTLAVVSDVQHRPLWVLHLAPTSHQLAAAAVGAIEAPPGQSYQLWVSQAAGAFSLGLLPVAGRKIIAETPLAILALTGSGTLLVTLEPARGSITGQPSGPVVFRAQFPAASPSG